MTRQKSLITIVFMGMTLICTILVAVLIYTGVSGKIELTDAQVNSIRSTYIASQKQIIKTQAEQAIGYIVSQKALADERARSDVRSRTLEAWGIASHIYETAKDQVPVTDIKQRIHDALFPASWDNGNGYYFAEDTCGNEIINRNNPELEGTNLSHVLDSKGTNIMQVILNAAMSPPGEGFCYYYWNRPGKNPDQLAPKVSYVKYFAPLDWVIGNGKYIADEEEIIKAEVLKSIEQITYGNDGYIFAATWEGLSLTGPFAGENILAGPDPEGVRIVRELISLSKAGGGFIQYLAPEFKGRAPAMKISYVGAVPEWQWYVGSGIRIDDIEAGIIQQQDTLRTSIHTYIAKNIAILLLFLAISFFLLWFLSRKIKHNLDLFTRFFQQSAAGCIPIEKESIAFTEFQDLAESANRMSMERRRSEQALRESQQRLSLHLQNTPVGVVTFDPDFRVLEWNPAAESIFGYTCDEALGRKASELILPDEVLDEVNAVFKSILSGQDGKRSTNANLTKTGKRILCDWYNTVLYGVDGEVTGVASIVTDITERKRTEELLIQSEKMMSVGALAAGMAHEINNPLAGMMQNAQVIHRRLTLDVPANRTAADKAGIHLASLKSYMEERDLPRLFDLINSAGRDAARIVQNMLDFTRKKSSEKSLHRIPELLDMTIELAANDYNLMKHYDIKQITFVREYQPGVPEIFCEAGNLQQVFFNIIKNAAEAMFESRSPETPPKITLRIINSGSGLRIEIEDNGPGMDPDTCSHIFDPFFTTKDVDKGTGLGLSVSYFIIVDDHKGKLEVVSTPGRGTTFIINLPAL